MTTISSLQNTANSYSSDVNESASSTATPTSTSTNSKTDQASEKSDVSLSTRAQKIQALNEEFFPSGPSSVTISSEFIERLKEYGLISSEDAQQLTSSLTDNSDGEDTITLEKLSAETQDLISVLQQVEGTQNAANTLKEAQDVINSFDQFNSSTTELNNLSDSIKQFRLSSTADTLSASQQQTLKELELTLSVAAKLNPDTVSSAVINQYLAVNEL